MRRAIAASASWGLTLCCLLLATVALPQNGSPLPAKQNKLVYDLANVLAQANEQALERKLVAYNDSTGTQIAVVIERSLAGGDAFDRSFAIADAWGIGGERNDNGILLYVAVDDRAIYVQTGYGVEDRLTDALSRRIIDQVIAPQFRSGQYYVGIDRATSAMIQVLAGRYKAEPQERNEGSSPFTTLLLFVGIFVVLTWLLSRRGGGDDDGDGGYYKDGRYQGSRRGRGRRGGGWVILPGGGFGGGGFGGGGGLGGGGGGFGGFGGGGFGGGGAGGSW